MPIPKKNANKFLSAQLKATKKKYDVHIFSSRKDKEGSEKLAYSAILKDTSMPSEYRNAADKKLIVLEAKGMQADLYSQLNKYRENNMQLVYNNRDVKEWFIAEQLRRSSENLKVGRITPSADAMNQLKLKIFEQTNPSDKILAWLGVTTFVVGGIVAMCLSLGVGNVPALVNNLSSASIVAILGCISTLGGLFGAHGCIEKSIIDRKHLQRAVQKSCSTREHERIAAERLAAQPHQVQRQIQNRPLARRNLQHETETLITQPVNVVPRMQPQNIL